MLALDLRTCNRPEGNVHSSVAACAEEALSAIALSTCLSGGAMNFKLIIAVASAVILFGFLGRGLWTMSRPEKSTLSATAPRPRTERVSEADQDRPPPYLDTPARHLRTHWNPLDDTGTSHRCNQDNTQQNQNECPIAASPVNPSIVIVGANDFRWGSWAIGVYRTTDAGETWLDALMAAGPQHLCAAGDPGITVDGSGRIYVTYLTVACTSYSMYTHTSIDNGATWSNPVGVALSAGDSPDKCLSASDYSPGSPYQNNHYVVWQGFQNRIRLARSTNGGASYSTPIVISSVMGCGFPCVTVGPNGEVYAAWNYGPTHDFHFNRSLDGGVTWGNDVLVQHWTSSDNIGSCSQFRVTEYSAIACDISNSPYSGYVYIAWFASRDGTGDTDIGFNRSMDGGVTWSDSVRLNDDNTTRAQWWPWIAVHPVTGDIGVAWLDKRQDSQDCRYDIWGTISTDGGETWCSNLQISDSLVDPSESDFLGDYTGTTFCDLGFFTAWPDPRNDISDVYATWWNNGFGLGINSPVAGGAVSPGEVDTISWTFRYAPDSLSIELNRNYPSGAWEHLANVRSRDRFWLWPVSGSYTSHARLRIGNFLYPTFGDTTDGDFAIIPAPTRLTVHRVNSDICLRWQTVGAPYYRIYSSSAPDGSFATYEGSTSATVFLDVSAVNEPAKFYVVRASTEP
jgi:hypothetical protein